MEKKFGSKNRNGWGGQPSLFVSGPLASGAGRMPAFGAIIAPHVARATGTVHRPKTFAPPQTVTGLRLGH